MLNVGIRVLFASSVAIVVRLNDCVVNRLAIYVDLIGSKDGVFAFRTWV